MHRENDIKRLLAGFILLVFAFSITPRVVLHSWFASHSDATATKSSAQPGQQIAKSTFNCNCDNVVAESPFTAPPTAVQQHVLQHFSPRQQSPNPTIYFATHFLFSLRGPPAAC